MIRITHRINREYIKIILKRAITRTKILKIMAPVPPPHPAKKRRDIFSYVLWISKPKNYVPGSKGAPRRSRQTAIIETIIKTDKHKFELREHLETPFGFQTYLPSVFVQGAVQINQGIFF